MYIIHTSQISTKTTTSFFPHIRGLGQLSKEVESCYIVDNFGTSVGQVAEKTILNLQEDFGKEGMLRRWFCYFVCHVSQNRGAN